MNYNQLIIDALSEERDRMRKRKIHLVGTLQMETQKYNRFGLRGEIAQTEKKIDRLTKLMKRYSE